MRNARPYARYPTNPARFPGVPRGWPLAVHDRYARAGSGTDARCQPYTPPATTRPRFTVAHARFPPNR